MVYVLSSAPLHLPHRVTDQRLPGLTLATLVACLDVLYVFTCLDDYVFSRISHAHAKDCPWNADLRAPCRLQGGVVGSCMA